MKINAALFILVISLAFPVSAFAVHKGAGNLVCGSCHTMHNSQGDSGMGGNTGGSIILLRGQVTSRDQMHKLCLQCHAVGGAQADTAFEPHGQQAPKVYGGNSLNWDQTKDFGSIGAGGDFFKELLPNFDLSADGALYALGYGHSVGMKEVVPPGNVTGSMNTTHLTCTSCHSPHGADMPPGTDVMKPNVFRNLWVMNTMNVRQEEEGWDCLLCHDAPSEFRGSGFLNQMKGWVGGITGRFDQGGNYTPVTVNGVAVWPVYKDNPSLPANNTVYDGIKDTVEGDGGMGSWCAKCHHVFHEYRQTANVAGEDWNRHPVSKIISSTEVSGNDIKTIKWDHYNNDIQPGYKVPTAYAGDISNIGNKHYYADTDGEFKVFCLSCHFAHGSPYYDGLRWEHNSSVSQGGQVSNIVPSNRGCQQCHNK